jgi:hypothetical protein
MLGANHEGAVIPIGTGTLACAAEFYVAPAFRRHLSSFHLSGL